MTWTHEDALKHGSVQDPMVLIGEYRFQLRNLRPRITLKLWKKMDGTQFFTELSHDIKVSGQLKYVSSIHSDSDSGRALLRAVTGLTDFFDAAIRDGHTASEEWLVLNDDFGR